MIKRFWLILVLLVSAGSGSEEGPISRIVFGSCANQSSPQPVWDSIISFNPQLFIWLGDNIYGDIRRPFTVFGKERTIGPWKNVPRFYPSSQDEMKARYLQAKTNPGYSKLVKNTSSIVIGTWDDHDFGLNDAGKEFSNKIANQKLMLDFLDEPQDSPRRKQAGVYASHIFGPVGRQIKVILLDTRYHRDPISSDGSMLGDQQWRWFEGELNAPPTALTVIGSSIQPNYGTIQIDWGSHPVSVKLEVRDTNGTPIIAKNIPLSDLQFQEPHSNLCAKKGNYQRHCTLEVDLPWIIRYRLAILFFCTSAVLLLLLAG